MQIKNSDFIDFFETSSGKKVSFYSLKKLEAAGIAKVSTLPFSIRILLESMLRNLDGKEVTEKDLLAIANWNAENPEDVDLPFKVSRILMQDFTGVPAVVDIAALREYAKESGFDPKIIKPLLPVDLIIDHSVQVDMYNDPNALRINQEREMERNSERYKLLKWAGRAFKGFGVVPPSGGICHQVNLEKLGTCVTLAEKDGGYIAYPDTLVGTDSHTTMINGLGIVGFGVGGIEAEAALLNQPVVIPNPKVLGVKLTGKLNEGVTATDLALTITHRLREHGVVGMFVEFFGEGVKNLTLQDRATTSNMCPEYGATISLFSVDDETIRYMKSTGRSQEQIEVIQKYYEKQGMLNIDYSKVRYSSVVEIDLSTIKPSVSGPSQPKQQVELSQISKTFIDSFLNGSVEEPSDKDQARWKNESDAAVDNGVEIEAHRNLRSVDIIYEDGSRGKLREGDVVISAITSCTNTSNPFVMVGAGLLAKKALEKGLSVDTKKVKTSLAPGSRVVIDYLEKAGLIEPLEKLGYSLVGFGCTTCIGNSGPLPGPISKAIESSKIATASVLSGNRNFEARIHSEVSANYLMSPPLVIAFGIAGTVMKDLTKEPLGVGKDGKPVYLRDIWPSNDEINSIVGRVVETEMYKKEYERIFGVNDYWNKLDTPSGDTYAWEENSTYIRLPPFFEGFDPKRVRNLEPIKNAMTLGVFGDSTSTDHISPAGEIKADSPAGKYLIEHGVNTSNFNTYGSRRGNHEVMMRGTFANVKIKNLMLDGVQGGMTVHYPDGRIMSIYDAAMLYKREGKSLVVFGGKEYGSGSSRDWAAKGPMLLGVKAVVAKSFERIHRSNLVGMGIIPLQFSEGEGFAELGIDQSKPISIMLDESLKQKSKVKMKYYSKDGNEREAMLTLRLDSELEMEYYRRGGVLNYVLAKILNGG
ncbi:MAG: aconitate hydratase AcnA [Candidatus Micrarchaeaceae archaeon]